MGAEIHCLHGQISLTASSISPATSASRSSSSATACAGGPLPCWRSPVDRLIAAADEFDVRIFPHRNSRNGRGKLKVYLGYAAGVGKTYRMLEEAQDCGKRASMSPSATSNLTAAKRPSPRPKAWRLCRAARLHMAILRSKRWIPDAILRRKPQVAVVDEFAHTNVPGSERSSVGKT